MKSVSEVFNEICAFEERVGLFYESVSDEVKQQYGKFFDKLAEDEYRHSKIYKALGEKAVRDERIILTDEDAVFMRSMFANSTLGEDFDFKKMSKINDKWQILDLAEKIEREATGYVQDVMGFFPDFAPDEVRILLKEERNHLQMILDKKNQMTVGFLGL